MARRPASDQISLSARQFWPTKTELVGLEFALQPQESYRLPGDYTKGLHAWFLQQIQTFDPALSAHLHDAEAEKAFNISGLDGQFTTRSRELQLQAGQTYHWRVHGFSLTAVKGLARWLKRLPPTVALKGAPLQILGVRRALLPTTYGALLQGEAGRQLSLSFVSPTSFRRKGHHLPLPWPRNVFHSYLRRWNEFTEGVEMAEFLDWIDEMVIIQRCQLETTKVAVGKGGSVTGFTGAVTYGLSGRGASHEGHRQLFFALGQFAPYCGTGHKTPFGLGQTRLGWQQAAAVAQPTAETLVAERIEELTEQFVALKKRQGGSRAQQSAQRWATVLARRELGDSLGEIAADLEMPYETVKTYVKLARRALRELEH